MFYKNKFSYYDPLNIVFLCGNKYSKSNQREKRCILKNYLEETIPKCHAIILEENFNFGLTNMKYLSYDDVFLKGLAQVEELASLYANKIIIIHETISTAAELGMFAINPSISQKICLLTPDDISIEENKISGFIKLAFMNANDPITRIGKHIIYYPDVDVYKKSEYKSDYYTFFHNNKIGDNLGEKIVAFVTPKRQKKSIIFRKSQFKNATKDPQKIDYWIDEDQKKVQAFIHVDVLKIQLLSLFFISEMRKEFRFKKDIKDHVTYICNEFNKIMLNTIIALEGISFEKYGIKLTLKGTNCKLRQAVGYFLYMLQAAHLIGLEQSKKSEMTQRKIRISGELDNYKDEFSSLIYSKEETAFGRLGL